MRPLRPPSQARTAARLSGRSRNLERRYIPSDTVKQPVMQLWSTSADGTTTIPSGAGVEGVNLFYHHLAYSPADTPFWTNLYFESSVVTDPPYDQIEVPPGFYDIDAWSFANDGDTVTPIAVQLNLNRTASGLSPEPFGALVVPKVWDGSSISGPLNSDNTGHFFHNAGFYVDDAPGNSGFIDLFCWKGAVMHDVTFNSVRTLTIAKRA